jgi:hypothetical protein
MTAPEPAKPATPDELATLFLRARDIACPACGYNRRGGVTAACPECRATLPVGETTQTLRPRTTQSIRRCARLTLIFACLLVIPTARSTWLTVDAWLTDPTSSLFAKPWFVYASLVTAVATLAAWIILIAMSALALRSPRTAGPDRPVRALLTGYTALLGAAMLSGIYNALWYILR